MLSARGPRVKQQLEETHLTDLNKTLIGAQFKGNIVQITKITISTVITVSIWSHTGVTSKWTFASMLLFKQHS